MKSANLTLGNCLMAVAVVGACASLAAPIIASAKAPGNSLTRGRTLAAAEAMYAVDYEAPAVTPCVTEGDGFVNDPAGCLDTTSGLIWSGSIYLNWGQPLGFPTYYQARDYCAALTDGGLTGWQLPTKTEMQSASTRRAAWHVQQSYDPNANPNASFYNYSGTLKGTNYVYTVDLRSGSAFAALIYNKRWGSYTQVDGNCVHSSP